MKLKDMVTIVHNDMESIVLEVKENQKMNLICLGCFRGDEILIRLTKGGDHTCTIWYKDGTVFDWHWGSRGTTLVAPNTDNMRKKIVDCIEIDFGVILEGKNISKTLYVELPEHKNDIFKASWRDGNPNIFVDKNGEHWRNFQTIDAFEKALKDMGYSIKKRKITDGAYGYKSREYACNC